MSSINFSTDEKHKESLAMLEDVLAYLKRMPNVPVTVDFCRKIQEHLDAPTNRLVMSARETWRGEVFTAAGVKLLDATLCDDRLSVTLPAKPNGMSADSYERLAIDHLRKGVGVTLKNHGFEPEA